VRVQERYEIHATPVKYRCLHNIKEEPCMIHEHVEILYMREGQFTLTVDGQTTTLQSGDLCFCAPLVIHQNEAAPCMKADLLLFTPDCCRGSVQKLLSNVPANPFLRREQVSPLAKELLDVLGGKTARLEQIYQEEYEQHEAGRAALLEQEQAALGTYLSVLVYELMGQMELKPTGSVRKGTAGEVLRYCMEHHREDLSRSMIAEALGTSPATVSRVFTRLNTTLRDYVNSLRMDTAYQLLTTTTRSITAIMYECGFNNQGTFNRNFYQSFGMTPSELRKKN